MRPILLIRRLAAQYQGAKQLGAVKPSAREFQRRIGAEDASSPFSGCLENGTPYQRT
jgi:hypothetical protein